MALPLSVIESQGSSAHPEGAIASDWTVLVRPFVFAAVYAYGLEQKETKWFSQQDQDGLLLPIYMKTLRNNPRSEVTLFFIGKLCLDTVGIGVAGEG